MATKTAGRDAFAGATRPPIPGFDAAKAGCRAECDGGGMIPETKYAGREEFSGTLTGEYVDHGDPPWRWYLMDRLAERPDGYVYDSVWCLAGNVFVAGEPDAVIPGTSR